MKNELLIPKNILYPIAVFGIILTVFTVSFDLTSLGISLEAGKILTYIALLCNFITAAVLIIDVFKNNNAAKFLWALAFLFFGSLAGYIYLRKRDGNVSKA